MTGLIGAMAEEIALFEEHLDLHQSKSIAGMTYLRGILQGQEVVLLQTGIGKVSATIGTQIMIDHFGIDRIIFTGLAGSLVPNLTQGDMVVANTVSQYDFDLTAFGRRHGELPDIGRTIEADPRLVKLACYAYDDCYKSIADAPKLMVGSIVSGDRFVSDPRKIEWLQREFGAIATEMEGAAVGYTCYVNKVPFVIIRSISDSADSDAVEAFDRFLVKASENSFQIVSSILEVMTHRAEAAELS